MADKVLLDSDQPSFTVPSPADSVPVWFRGRGGRVGVSVHIYPPTLYPSGVMGGNPVAGRCFKDLGPAGIAFTVFVVWRVGFGVPAGWGSGSGRTGLRPAVGFRVRRFGVEMKPSLGTENPLQTTKMMTTMCEVEKYLVDRGYR